MVVKVKWACTTVMHRFQPPTCLGMKKCNRVNTLKFCSLRFSSINKRHQNVADAIFNHWLAARRRPFLRNTII